MNSDRNLQTNTAETDLIFELRAKLREAEETLDAIRNGEVDALVMQQAGSSQIFTLKDADRPYRFLIEQMREGAITFSHDGTILYGNRRLAEILGMPLEKIVGSSFKRFFSMSEWLRFENMLHLRSVEPSRAEFTVQCENNKACAVLISVNDIVTDDGDAPLFGAVITDLTDQHAMEARLTQAQKMEAVGQLTGGLAHDFNNLLQVICGNLNLIKLRPDDSNRVRQWAENSLKAADRGAKLTSQLLAFSRSQQIDLQEINVGELVHEMSALLTATLGRNIEINYIIDNEDVIVLADQTQLELALLNLAINARDAMPKGGRLFISTVRRHIKNDPELQPGVYLALSVADTGAGMTSHVRMRAFDPFFTTKKVGEGTGLGLAQVFGIARQAGGTARIDSEQGKGTTVTILLKTIDEIKHASPMQKKSDMNASINVKNCRVFVVDDDNDVRQILVESLEILGYKVTQAADGFTGLQMMIESRPDLLLIDYAMPGLNGAEVVKQARQAGLDMPVIFASGYSDTFALNDAVGIKAKVLLKPFTLATLADTLQDALR